MKLFALIVLAATLPLSAQTAKVIVLSPTDAADAKYLYEQRDNINKRIADFQRKIEGTYLMEEKPGPNPFIGVITTCGFNSTRFCTTSPDVSKPDPTKKKETHLERKDGWGSFEYSDDFKYIVPLAYKPPPASTCYANPALFGVLTGN